jgi:glucose-6-phosphate 1-dehydrogenase
MLTVDNPLAEGFLIEKLPEPATIVIFGASGDLTKRKLIPALFDQFVEHHLPQGFTIIGCARTAMSEDAFRERMFEEVGKYARHTPDRQTWDSFATGLFYVSADFDDDAAWARLGASFRAKVADRVQSNNWLLYMTTPPPATLKILRGLWLAGFAAGRPIDAASPPAESGWTRVILEKPFGHSLEESGRLNTAINEIFREDQVYRIDHYLGKEAVQNILVFRFANRIFEPVWNNRYVDHVQITVAETVGVEARGGYYETSGALRDMVQNHMLQVLALVAMEPPTHFAADAVRDEKVKVLRAVHPLGVKELERDVVRAQYAEGYVGGVSVPAYRNEHGVANDSVTETYVALKLRIDNWRWADVPFYLRTGKRLPKRVSEVAIQFKPVPHMLFARTPADQVEPNLLVLRIQPDEGISLRFEAKMPGANVRLRSLNMDFQYGQAFGQAPPEAYERLLGDCLLGDSTLFSRRDGVDASWGIVMPILDAWSAARTSSIPRYEAGTWGPQEADDLLERDGRRWHRL